MSTNTPDYPTLPSIPQLPELGSNAPNAASRQWLISQLPSFAQQNQAALTGIQSGAKMGLAGYGGYSFAKDNPNTPQREDLTVAFNPNAGPGQREKQAFQGVRNSANAQGTLYSSFTNQNIASAAQRLSLEAQQIVNQYASSINQQQTAYANQVAGVIGQWVGLYGQDAQYLAENPPPTPPIPTAYESAVAAANAGQLAKSGQGEPIIWKGTKSPNMTTLQAQYPGANIQIRKMGGGGYAAVLVG
jgi:hypothetical protein